MKQPQLILAPEATRLALLLDKLANAITPIEKRLGIDLWGLSEMQDHDPDHPAVELNNAITDASVLLGEMVDVVEKLNRSRAKAYNLAG